MLNGWTVCYRLGKPLTLDPKDLKKAFGIVESNYGHRNLAFSWARYVQSFNTGGKHVN